MTTFLHEAPASCCRAVLYYAARRVTRLGPVHSLPVICAGPVAEGASFCTDHAAAFLAPSAAPPAAPADRHRVSRPAPADVATPDLCTLISE